MVSGDIVHAEDTVVIEATVRPWQQESRNVRIPVKIPSRLAEEESTHFDLGWRNPGSNIGTAASHR